MTWPWVTHLRDAVTDPGDPYLNSWILWWDYHQTFHDPLNLFHANIYYPYRYTLAFSEHNYGISLLFFPLFALGLRPLTINGLATLLGFSFSGYGMFRLTRTVTGCTGAGLIAGIIFAFAPYRFEQIFHLNYLFAGWIPILLEALVLFARERSWKHAVWLGAAFLMNGLTCVHWFVLTLLPLLFSAIFLITKYRAWRDLNLWKRAAVTLGLAAAALVPFFIPYWKAGQLYGFVRTEKDALIYSATYSDWLVSSYLNKIWYWLGSTARKGERTLFPGVVPPALAVIGLLSFSFPRFTRRQAIDNKLRADVSRKTKIALDLAIVTLGYMFLKTWLTGSLKIRVFGYYLLKLFNADGIAIVLGAIILIRLFIAFPHIIARLKTIGVPVLVRNAPWSEGVCLGLIWLVLGFFGSLGMNFFFHRALFAYIPLFRGIRVPARWATICFVGLALLAGIGAYRIAEWGRKLWPHPRPIIILIIIAMGLLFEERAAPLELNHGAVDADELTLRLKNTPMTGGIAELPTRYGSQANYLYVLRAADHGRPLITAFSGFEPPMPHEIESLSNENPIPDSLLNLLESVPTSYLIINNGFMGPTERAVVEAFLARGITANRIKFVKGYEGADLYAITKVEPNAISEGPLPFLINKASSSPVLAPDARAVAEAHSLIDDARYFTRMQYLDFLGREPEPAGLDYWTRQIEQCGKQAVCLEEQRVNVSAAFVEGKEFQETSFFVHRLYKATLGRAPSYEEFKLSRAKLVPGPGLESSKSALIEEWLKSPLFVRLYATRSTPEEFVDAILRTIKETSPTTLDDQRGQFVSELKQGSSRAKFLREIIDDPRLIKAEYDRAFVLMQYFSYLHRDPDPDGYTFWLDILRKQSGNPNREMMRVFIKSKEYRDRFRH
jgi:hypothetical protein